MKCIKVICANCGKGWDIAELLYDENKHPWCPECECDKWRDMDDVALRYAEQHGIYEYKVQRQWIEYWSFFPGEGFRFIRRNLITGAENRDVLIPWTQADEYPVPKFLHNDAGATLYNYCCG